MRPSVPGAPRNWPLRRLAGKVPSCRPTGTIDCRFEVRATLRRVAPAQTLPRGVGARGWRRICSPELFLSPPRRNRSRLRRGFVFSKNRILGSASELVLGVKTRRRHGALFAPGLSLWVFSRDTHFCLYRKVSYPAFRPPRVNVSYTVTKECEKRAGEYQENGTGEDRDPLH